jgi:hypothetical protein
MIRRSVFVSLLLIPSSALCSERIVVYDNSAETAIKDRVRTVSEAFDKEDINLFESCFRTSKRKPVRRKAALFFAANHCSMDLEDVHVIEAGEASAEVAVKYRMGSSSGGLEIVSVVYMVKEGEFWLIDRESIQSKTPTGKAENLASSKSRIRPDGAGWNEFAPDPNRIPEGLKHLIGDIGIREGMGCADGRCQVK